MSFPLSLKFDWWFHLRNQRLWLFSCNFGIDRVMWNSATWKWNRLQTERLGTNLDLQTQRFHSQNCFELASVKATNKTEDYLKTSHEQLANKNAIQKTDYDMQMIRKDFERGSCAYCKEDYRWNLNPRYSWSEKKYLTWHSLSIRKKCFAFRIKISKNILAEYDSFLLGRK